MWTDRLQQLKNKAIRAISRERGEKITTRVFFDLGECRCADWDDAWLVLPKDGEPFLRGKRSESAKDSSDDKPIREFDAEQVLEMADRIGAGQRRRYFIQGFFVDGYIYRHSARFFKRENAERALSALKACGRYKDLEIVTEQIL